ncbi:ABC transporter permease [Clostridium frigidicarnis]|uniref:Putative spermidine/putrescine transport system permease protein n=1 Tax=Clostridium frigidicarnis TaxID=84698 RepID=A0A1I0W7J1_9CLOT|nr:ABC transporter permease subunit [Clostridium frigidicarnis]SFA84003.1 putative spermidine/putrescine transport system permease protein [Clostridium frigidicarnis]
MKKLSPYILLLPCSLFLIITLGFGVIEGILQSLGFMPSLGMEEVTFKYYAELFKDGEFTKSLLFSLKTSLISSILSVIIGVFIAYILYKRKSRLNNLIIKLPMVIPHIVVVFIILSIFSQGGYISRIMNNLFMISDFNEFPLLINDQYGIGIVIAYLWKEIPFVAIITYDILNNINKDFIIAAKNLGANKGQIFSKILLPLSKKSIITSFLIIFAFSFGAFEVPYLLGPTMPKALPVKAFIEYSSSDLFNRPYAMAINTVLSFISLVIMVFYEISFRKTLK